jgi:hypothetical protein
LIRVPRRKLTSQRYIPFDLTANQIRILVYGLSRALEREPRHDRISEMMHLRGKLRRELLP